MNTTRKLPISRAELLAFAEQIKRVTRSYFEDSLREELKFQEIEKRRQRQAAYRRDRHGPYGRQPHQRKK